MDATSRDLLSTQFTFADARVARSRWIATLVWTIVALAGCGGGGATAAPAKNTVDTSTLAGKWAGSVNGDGSANSYGFSSASTEMKADSTLSLVAENPKYGNVTGVWTVSAGKWMATGKDRDGVTINFTSPVTPYTLTGTWTASSGKVGIFTLSKLP